MAVSISMNYLNTHNTSNCAQPTSTNNFYKILEGSFPELFKKISELKAIIAVSVIFGRKYLGFS